MGRVGLVIAVVGGALLLAEPAGASAPPAINLDVISATMGPQAVGTTSAPTTIRMWNRGPGTATNIVVGAPSDPQFAVASTTCGAPVPEGGSCTFDLTYRPDSVAPAEGYLGVLVPGGGYARLGLTGQPAADSFPLAITATSLDFGPRAQGTVSPGQAVRIINPGASPVSFALTVGAVTGRFRHDFGSCSEPAMVLDAGASCTVGYRFAPTAFGTATGASSVRVAVVAGPVTEVPVELTGHGGTIGADPVRVTPQHLDFGPVPIGTTSAPQSITFTNVSGVALAIPPNLGRPDARFPGTTNCPSKLAAGASCTSTYSFVATSPGLQSSIAQIGYNWQARRNVFHPVLFTGSGAGTGPRLDIDRSEVQVGQGSAQGSAPPVVHVTNTGDAPLEDVAVAQAAPILDQFHVDDACPDVLPAGAGCDLTFTGPVTLSYSTYRFWNVTGSGQTRVVATRGGRIQAVNEAYVTTLAHTILGESTPAGVADALDAGTTTRSAVVADMVGSSGFLYNLLSTAYYKAVGRPPDASGRRHYQALIRSGDLTVADVVARLSGSAEAYRLSGGTDAGWLERMYQSLLDRNIDPAGLDYWQGQVRRRGRTAVAAILYESPEGRRSRVRIIYRQMLDRRPDPSGTNYWAAVLETHSDDVVYRALAVSDEYVRLAQYVITFTG